MKAANKPTTSTATKSASQDLTDKDGILLWFGEYIAWKNHWPSHWRGGRYYPSVVQEAYDNVPNDKRFDPRMHGSCAKVEALSKEAEKANVTNMEELRKLAKNSVSTANRNDKKGKPMRACPSCSHVLKNLGIRDGNGG